MKNCNTKNIKLIPFYHVNYKLTWGCLPITLVRVINNKSIDYKNKFYENRVCFL